MWGCMRYLSPVSVLPAVEDRQLSICVEKQHVALTGKKSNVLLNSTDSKTCFSHLKENIFLSEHYILGNWIYMYFLAVSSKTRLAVQQYNPTSEDPNYDFDTMISYHGNKLYTHLCPTEKFSLCQH